MSREAPPGSSSAARLAVGLYLSAQHRPGADMGRALQEHLEQARFARDHGLAAILAPQHFLAEPYPMLQPLPLLARVAGEAPGIRVGAGVMLLTLLNPVDVAESVATLDVITGGRFVLGVGLGYRAQESAAFAVPDARGGVLAAKCDVVRRLLEGETVTASGHGYRLEGARLSLRPIQRPRPPIWMAANSDAGVRRVARLADTWLLNPHATIDQLERQVALFLAERGAPPDELPLVREACVAETDDEAVATARPHLEAKYRAYVAWGQSEVMPAGDTLRRGWEDLRSGRFVVGAPGSVVRQIRDLRRRLGATLLLLRVQWPGMPHRHAMRTLRLLAEEVMPEL